ncbi:hypothetical protein [Acidithrix sp. C25]|uniref:hypothetical protein n=1 Tax=Acidithrix sp. C25 TaxID=1671482 RepID=UPI00191BBD37|nr:hypothetical protein [Acidithrix sp. C25]
MKRTVRLATLPLNKNKYDETRSVIGHYSDAKRIFVAHLRQTSLWRLLDRSKSFRDYAKAELSQRKWTLRLPTYDVG